MLHGQQASEFSDINTPGNIERLAHELEASGSLKDAAALLRARRAAR
jgi:hypothetical protein